MKQLSDNNTLESIISSSIGNFIMSLVIVSVFFLGYKIDYLILYFFTVLFIFCLISLKTGLFIKYKSKKVFYDENFFYVKERKDFIKIRFDEIKGLIKIRKNIYCIEMYNSKKYFFIHQNLTIAGMALNEESKLIEYLKSKIG